TAVARAAESAYRWSSSFADTPSLTTKLVASRLVSAGLAAESRCGAKPARSSRYSTEHSAQLPVAGQPDSPGFVAVADLAAVVVSDLGGGAPGLPHATARSAPQSHSLTLRHSPTRPRSTRDAANACVACAEDPCRERPTRRRG